MLFNESTYKRLGAALLLVLVGFTAMYIENEVKGIISLYISPLLILAGYALVVHAILVYKGKDEQEKSAN
jgi:hypothetical protein